MLPSCCRGAAVAATVFLCAPGAAASIIGFDLTGAGASTGLPTSAHVEIDIAADGSWATFYVENSSPTASGPDGSPDAPSDGDAPILTIFGFQADATPSDFDLVIVSPSDRFFDRSGHPSSLGAGGPFEFRVDADNPRPGNGLAVGESLELTLTAVGGFSFSENVFLDAPLNRRGFLMAARFQVVGPDGEDSSAGTAVPEPAVVFALLCPALLFLRRRR